jgi:hypothetical protein
VSLSLVGKTTSWFFPINLFVSLYNFLVSFLHSIMFVEYHRPTSYTTRSSI